MIDKVLSDITVVTVAAGDKGPGRRQCSPEGNTKKSRSHLFQLFEGDQQDLQSCANLSSSRSACLFPHY